jgi:GntR family transcriptional regulator
MLCAARHGCQFNTLVSKIRKNTPVPVPRYRLIADRLIEDIRSGAMEVGQTMPGEIELTRRFKVSRHTVRDALRTLDELGLIDRRQGIGTVVRARQSAQAYVQTVKSPAELMQYPSDARLNVVSSEEIRVSRKIAKMIGCRSGTRWLQVSAVRHLKDSRVPISWVDIYLLPEFAAIVPSIGKRSLRVYQLIQNRFSLTPARVAIDIRASLIPDRLTEVLQVSRGTPSLTVIRRYTSEDRRLFLAAVSEHPADRYHYSLHLSRGWQSRDGGAWA